MLAAARLILSAAKFVPFGKRNCPEEIKAVAALFVRLQRYRHGCGKLKDRNPGNAVISQLQFSGFTKLFSAGKLYSNCSRAAHACDGFVKFFFTAQCSQRRKVRILFECKRYSQAACTERFFGRYSRRCPAGYNQPVEMILSLIGEHLPAALLHAELLNPTVTDDANLFSFQLFPEKIKDGRCLSAIGIQVAVFLRQIKSSFLKKADRSVCLETRKELRQPVRVVASVIPLRRKISIAEVALSVSGRQYLAANPVTTFQYGNFRIIY